MRWVALVVVVALVACHSTRTVDVRLAGNPQGAECFAACVQGARPPVGGDPDEVDDNAVEACVATCPGAVTDEGCSGPACIETRKVSWWKVTLWIVGGVVLVALVSPNGPLSNGSSLE